MSYLKYFESKEAGVVVVSMGPGDLFLEGIAEVAKKCDIHTGIIQCGLGALKKANFNAGSENKELEGFYQIFNFTGHIISYMPHVHMTIVDIHSGEVSGGHLNDGSVVGAVVEFSIVRLPDLKLVSDFRDGSTVKLLDYAKE